MGTYIRFGNGSVHRCVGRVRNGQTVPWADEADLRSHIAYINEKNPDISVEIVRIVSDAIVDGTATAAANGDLPVPQDCQARAGTASPSASLHGGIA